MTSGPGTIERVDVVEFVHRLPELRARAQPVVVSGLLGHGALSQLDGVEGARALLGQERMGYTIRYLDLNRERVRRHRMGAKMPSGDGQSEGTFDEYLDLIERDDRYIVSEQPSPAGLLIDVDLSAVGVESVVAGSLVPYTPTPPDVAHSFIFSAGPRNASDLHMDGDGRDVLLYQGFGRKRVCVFPPCAGPVLHPIANYSTVRLAEMTDEERGAFLAYAGGVETVVEPGETVFFPAFVWHHLEYLEHSMSVAFRFGGVDDPLALELLQRVPLDHNLQRIIIGTRDPATAEASQRAARVVLAAANRPYPSARAKYRAVREVSARNAPAGVDGAGRRYLDGLVEAEEFLDGGLSGFYSRSPWGPGSHDRLWHARERVRDILRRRARGVAYWA